MVIHTLALPRQSSLIAHGDNSWSSAPLSSRDGKFDDTQRQIWSIDWDYFSRSFVNQRQASSLMRGNKYGHLHPLSKIQCLSTETTLVPPFAIQRQSSPMAYKDCSGHLLLLFQDYQSPLYHPKTSDSNDIRDNDGHLFLIIWRFFAASFVI